MAQRPELQRKLVSRLNVLQVLSFATDITGSKGILKLCIEKLNLKKGGINVQFVMDENIGELDDTNFKAQVQSSIKNLRVKLQTERLMTSTDGPKTFKEGNTKVNRDTNPMSLYYKSKCHIGILKLKHEST